MFDTLTIDQVKEICPDCAKKMEEQNITSVKFQEGIKLVAPDGRPPKAWWDKCEAKNKGKVRDVGAYCGWLWHHVVVEKGATPAEVLTEDHSEEFKGQTPRKSTEEVRKSKEETYTLEDVEIFKVGTWNGDTYTQKDINAIVDNFWELREKVKPPVKVGHSEKQALLKKEGMPAAGWITKLRARGDTILATLSNIPKKIYDLLAKKAYNRVSSEIYPEYETEGKKYSPVLRAIAFLGADVPAIETIGDIEALYSKQEGNTTWYSFSQTQLKGGGGIMKIRKKSKDVAGKVTDIIATKLADKIKKHQVDVEGATEEVVEAVTEAVVEAIEEKKEEIKAEIKPEVEAAIAEAPAPEVTAPAETQEEDKDKIISDLKARIKELEDELATVRGEKTELLTEKKKSEIDGVINKAKQEGRLIPKMENALRTLMEQADDVKVVKFKEGDKEEDLTQFEVIKRHIASIPNIVQFAEISKSGEKFEVKTSYQMPDGSLVPIKDGEMALKAKKYSEEHNVPYAEAIVEVWKLSQNE